mgnify:CR=1 FL=1|jgi:hypothetical protein
MKDKMGEIFAEQFGGEVVPSDNSAQEAMVVDLTTPSSEPAEQSQTETPVENESSENSTTEPVKEETPAETVVETQDTNNRSLNNESNDQSSSEDEIRDNLDKTRKEFLRFVNDQFETNFDSMDSLKTTLRGQKTSFANEQIEKMNTFVNETGRTIADYIRTQAIDYSKMSNEDVMRLSMKQNNPELTMDEVNVLMESKYKLSKDKNSEADQTLGKIEMKKDVSKARKELIDIQNKYKMPIEEKGMSAEQEESIRSEWVENMSKEVDDVESITFDINDNGEQFTFELNEDHRNDLMESNSNLNGYFDRYVDDEGGWDFDKLNMDMIILNNFQDIVRSVANQYRSKGTEQVVRDIKNPSFNNEARQATGNEKSVQQTIEDIIFGENEGLTIG